jgi:hypothetical protein
MKILLAGGIIDFYVNPKKYKDYKTNSGKFNYVYRELEKKLKSLVGMTVNGITIRDASITSNNFWGIKKFCKPNDLNYSCNNEVPLREDKKTIRIFMIDIVGVYEGDVELKDQFFKVSEKDFHLTISNVKTV